MVPASAGRAAGLPLGPLPPMSSASTVHHAGGPLRASRLGRVVGRLRKAFPTLPDPFPQDVPFRCGTLKGGLPSFAGSPGTTPVRWLCADGPLDPARTSPQAVARVMTEVAGVLGARDRVQVYGGLDLPDDPHSTTGFRYGTAGLRLEDGEYWVWLSTGGIVFPQTGRGP